MFSVCRRSWDSTLCTVQHLFAVFSTMFPLGMMVPSIYDSYMNHHNHTSVTKQDTDRHISDPPAPLVSEMLPVFLDYLRVEEHRTPTTLIRYESHLQKFITTVGDCPITQITSENLSLFKRRLLDGALAPATMAAMLSGLRSFLRYLKEERGFQVYDPEKVRRPKIPKHEVEYLTKEEVQRFLNAIPMNTQPGLRDRALAEVLCITGMRIAEALSLNRAQIDWETRMALIVGKGNKPRKVYFTDSALAWLRSYLDIRHDDHPALFVTQGEAPIRLKAQGTWKRFHRYAKHAGIGKRVYPHMLRHTMATTLLANGCPIGHIRAMLGHEHLTTTCKYYLGIIAEADVKAAHAKYLSYEVNRGNTTCVKLPGQENIHPQGLTAT
jgi:integrase/recombinase XerD